MTEKDILEHKKHKRIKFDPILHEYEFFPDLRKSEGVEFQGITSLIKSFEPYKDWDKIAKGSSMNPRSEWYGMEVKDIRKAWSDKGKDSADAGSAIHKAIEDSVVHGVYDDDYAPYIDAFWETMDAHDIKPITAELVLYDESIKRASPIDIVGLRDSQMIIIDTKTFADGMTWTGYKGETFNAPLNHLQTSKYNKTCLQGSVYKKWSLDYGWDVGETYCFLINDDGYELIPLLYMEDEVLKMYEYSETEKAPWE